MSAGSASVPGSFGSNPAGIGPSHANQPAGVPASAMRRISGSRWRIAPADS